MRGLQGFPPRAGFNSTLPSSKTLTFQFGESLQGYLPGHGSTASSSSSHVPAGAVDEPVSRVFRTFPHGKKVRRYPAPRGRNCVRTLARGLHELSWLGAPLGHGTDGSTDFMVYDMRCGFSSWLPRGKSGACEVVTLLASLLPSGIWSSHWYRLSTSAVVTRQSTEAFGSIWSYYSWSARCSHLVIRCTVSSWLCTSQSCVRWLGVA